MKKPSFTKRITSLVLFSLITLTVTSINAQSINEKHIFNISPSPDYLIEYFKAIELNKILYFKFLIRENNDNIAYVLESSVNGAEFKSTQIKEGFKSPHGVPLLYCYSEKLTDNTTYRIKRISYGGDIDYSCPIIISKNQKSNEWTSCINNKNTIFHDGIKEIIPPLNSHNKDADEDNSMKLGVIQEDWVDIESIVSIYPNPNKGKVNINLGNLKNVSIKMFNVNGQLILQNENITSPLYQFEFNEIPGIYFVDVNVQNNTHRFTIVKR